MHDVTLLRGILEHFTPTTRNRSSTRLKFWMDSRHFFHFMVHVLDSQSSQISQTGPHHNHPHTLPLPSPEPSLPITLRHPLQLILLLNRIAITAPLGRINQLLSQTLGHALDIAESRLAGPDRQ